MANITGTNGKDILKGTPENDVIKGLGSNDLIIGGDLNNGSDLIDGGAGNDVVDYNIGGSNPNKFISLKLDSAGSLTIEKSSNATDSLLNIETIIAGSGGSSAIVLADFTGPITLDVDLSKNRMTYSSEFISSKTIIVKNFNDVFSYGNTRFKGNDLNNFFRGNGGSHIVFGSKGDDFLFGNKVATTINYSNLGHAVKLLPKGFSDSQGFITTSTIVEKQGVGTDTIEASKVIGTIDRENTIDISSAGNVFSLDVNLLTNSLKVSVKPPVAATSVLYSQWEVVNFTNVIGGKYDDTIVGSSKKGKLTGGGGNDRITGGNKKDTITGSDSTARGVGEIDTLTGGGGKDKFVLGDENGAYYVGKGKDDYALITDFNLFQDSISIGSLKNYSFALAGNNSIDLYSGKDIKTRDLIAKIQIAGGISTVSSNSKSIAGSNPTLDSIVAKLDIGSGT